MIANKICTLICMIIDTFSYHSNYGGHGCLQQVSGCFLEVRKYSGNTCYSLCFCTFSLAVIGIGIRVHHFKFYIRIVCRTLLTYTIA